MRLGAHGGEAPRARLGPRQPENLMAEVMSSRTMAEPMKPVAPVTKTRMESLRVFGEDIVRRLSC